LYKSSDVSDRSSTFLGGVNCDPTETCKEVTEDRALADAVETKQVAEGIAAMATRNGTESFIVRRLIVVLNSSVFDGDCCKMIESHQSC
jgi:hypothetical protein